MKYLIGMDGGGTKTKCLLTDIDLNPIYETTSGPSNFLVIGFEKVSLTIIGLIEQCVMETKIYYDDIDAIVLGTTGGGRRSDAELLENQILKDTLSKNISVKNFRVESDAVVALEGAFSGKPGSILIAGTGSIMFGKDEAGKIHRVGGFGKFIGDEGSGHTIGKKGLNAAARFFDGRNQHTIIADLLEQEFSISSSEKLITEVYRNNFDVAAIAQLVCAAADKGDVTAQRILEDEANELLLHVSSMKKKLNIETLKVALIGSLLTKPNYYSYLFSEMVVRRFDDVQIKEAEHSPEFGSVLIAKQLI